MARTFPTLGLSPIDVYRDKMERPMGYFEGVADATGTIPGIYTLVKNDAARTAGRMVGMSINVEPLAAVAAYGIYGAEVCVYATTATLTSAFKGLFVECQGFSGGIASDWYALYVYSAPSAAPGGACGIVRLDHNSAYATASFLEFNTAGTCPSFLFQLGSAATTTAWQETSGAVSGAGGWLKVRVATATRYIPLLTTVS